MHPDVDRILYTREVIAERVKELAAQVLAVYREQDFTVCVVLRGAFIFAADLVRHLPQQTDAVFVRASSYEDRTTSDGSPDLRIPDDFDWSGRHVLVVEDIVDTGHTLKKLLDEIGGRGTESVRACAFLDKPAHREADVDVEFVGFTLEGAPFVVGYGLDFAGRYRNLPFVAALKPEVLAGSAAGGDA